MNPDQIVTAELLAGLTKCPFCGANQTRIQFGDWATYACLSSLHVEQKASRCRSILCELAALRARVQELEEALSFVVPVCDRLHHPKRHQHNAKDECPVEAIIRKAKGTK